MIEKVKLFFQKYGIIGITVVVMAVAILVMIGISIFTAGRYNLTKITKHLDVILDKSKDKISDIKAKEITLEIEKKVKMTENVKEKDNLEHKLKMVNAVSDKKKRVDMLISLNKSIEIKL